MHRALIPGIAAATCGVGVGLIVKKNITPEIAGSKELIARLEIQQWPVQGQGEQLVEFYDPACPMSRQMHVDLTYLSQRQHFERVLVPVSLRVLPNGNTLADTMCEASDKEAFVMADIYSAVGADVTPLKIAPTQHGARLDCRSLVEQATLFTAGMSPDGAPAVPIVMFRNKMFVGSDSFEALRAELGIP